MRTICISNLGIGILGILALAACGGGGGGGGGVEIPSATLVHTLPLMSDPDLDGYLQEDGLGGWRWRPGLMTPRTGELYVGGENKDYRQFYTFDLSALPADATIVRATLRLFQTHVVGDPYDAIGDVVVDHVHYGEAIELADFEGNTFNRNIGTLSTDRAISYHELVVTSAVQIDWEGGRTRSQFRLRLAAGAFSIVNHQSDYVQFTDAEGSAGDAVHVPELVVRYTRP